MSLLISNRGKGGDDHVKAVKPGPSFDEMESGHSDQGQDGKGNSNQAKIAQSLHSGSDQLSVVRGQYETPIKLEFRILLHRN